MKKGWERKKLGDVATLQRGFDLPTQERISGDVPLVTSSGITDTHNKSLVPGPGVATGRSGSIGNVFYIEDDFWPLNTVLYVKDFHGNDPRFVFHLLKHFDLKRFASGSGVPTLNRNFVHDEIVNVPPLAEQRRIVGVLDEAFAGLATAQANAEKNLQNARALFESHLQSVFSQRGKGWVDKKLEDVLIVQPQNGWSPPAANHAETGTPVLTLSSVTGFLFRADKLKYTSAKTDPKARYWIQNGDFLITRSNTPELVGHVAIATGIERPTIYPDLIMRMKPDPKQAVTEFLYYQMRTPTLREEVTGRAQGANPTMKKISNGAVRTLPISLPPIEEQQAIVTQLDALSTETQRLASLYEQKLAALAALKKSLLHEAFSGEL